MTLVQQLHSCLGRTIDCCSSLGAKSIDIPLIVRVVSAWEAAFVIISQQISFVVVSSKTKINSSCIPKLLLHINPLPSASYQDKQWYRRLLRAFDDETISRETSMGGESLECLDEGLCFKISNELFTKVTSPHLPCIFLL